MAKNNLFSYTFPDSVSYKITAAMIILLYEDGVSSPLQRHDWNNEWNGGIQFITCNIVIVNTANSMECRLTEIPRCFKH